MNIFGELLLCLLQLHSEIVAMELPISERAQAFRENPDAMFFSTFILVGVPVGLYFNRQLFLQAKRGG